MLEISTHLKIETDVHEAEEGGTEVLDIDCCAKIMFDTGLWGLSFCRRIDTSEVDLGFFADLFIHIFCLSQAHTPQ